MQRRIGEIYEAIHAVHARSAWEKGVICYADELFTAYLEGRGLSLDDIRTRIGKITEADLLRGAPSWERYSRGGMALISNEDICRRLCAKAVFKKKMGGRVPPSTGGRDWLDFQATALEYAAKIVVGAVNWRNDGE